MRKTTGYYDVSTGIVRNGVADGLSAFAIALSGDGTGIDDADSTVLTALYGGISVRFQCLGKCFAFILIDLAADSELRSEASGAARESALICTLL